jgi:hypothetical protein
MQNKDILTIVILFSLLFFVSGVNAEQTKTQAYSFKNKETPAGTAKDFHVKFSPPPIVPPPLVLAPPGAFTGYIPGGNGVDFYGTGTGIGSDGTFLVTATFAGTNPGKVEGYWWTKDGSSANMNSLTNVLGVQHGKQKKGQFQFSMVPSTGNGTIGITVLSDLHIFQIPPGVPGDITAQQFASFILAIPYGAVEYDVTNIPTIPNQVVVFFTTFDGTDPNFTVNINQDSTQQTSFIYVDTSDIPTLSQWGLIILSLLFIASGILFIRRRQVSLSIAGAGATASSAQGFFITRPFFIIAAVLTGFTLVLFAANTMVTGSVSLKDLGGTLTSSVILAYIIHLLDIFKKNNQGEGA